MRTDRFNLDDLLSMDEHSEELLTLFRKIEKGAVFVYPTETIYGLGGIATPDVKSKVFRIKKRPVESQMTLIAGDIQIFSGLNLIFNKKAKILADTFWPGYLTLILPVSDSGERIGVRVSDHSFIQLMTKYVKEPLYSTSANISGERYINDPNIIYNLFSDKIDMMVDGGVLPKSLPSTVVDPNGEELVVLREGVIPSEKIESILN